MTWGDQQWNPRADRRSRGQRRSTEKPKKEVQKDRLPAYDSGSGAASSSAGAGSAPKQEALVQALLAIAAKDKNMASVVESLMPPDAADDQILKSQQQSLNRIRRCRQKIAKKEAAVASKAEQMKLFLESMKKHIAAEKQRHVTETAELEKEIAALKEELILLKNGQEKSEVQEDTLESLLSEDEAMHTNGEAALREQLAAAQNEAKEAQNLAYAMQAQVQAFMQYQQMAANAVMPAEIPPGLAPDAFSPQHPKRPSTQGQVLERNAKAPFGVVRVDGKETRESPYGRPGKVLPLQAEGGHDGSARGASGEGSMRHMD